MALGRPQERGGIVTLRLALQMTILAIASVLWIVTAPKVFRPQLKIDRFAPLKLTAYALIAGAAVGAIFDTVMNG